MQSNDRKRILVTGANGQLGREMRRLGAASPNEYTFTDVDELDITDSAAVMDCIAAGGHDGCVIHPCHSDEFPSKVKRPAFSVLDKSKIKQAFGLDIPHWRESMEYCIERIKKSGQQ